MQGKLWQSQIDNAIWKHYKQTEKLNAQSYKIQLLKAVQGIQSICTIQHTGSSMHFLHVVATTYVFQSTKLKIAALYHAVFPPELFKFDQWQRKHLPARKLCTCKKKTAEIRFVPTATEICKIKKNIAFMHWKCTCFSSSVAHTHTYTHTHKQGVKLQATETIKKINFV